MSSLKLPHFFRRDSSNTSRSSSRTATRDFSSIAHALQTPLPPSPAPSPAPSIISTARGRVRQRLNILRRNVVSVYVSAEDERRAREEGERRKERWRTERDEREECWGRDFKNHPHALRCHPCTLTSGSPPMLPSPPQPIRRSASFLRRASLSIRSFVGLARVSSTGERTSPTSPTPRTSYGFRSPGTTSPVLNTNSSSARSTIAGMPTATTTRLSLDNRRSRGSTRLSGYFPDFTWEAEFTEGSGMLKEEEEEKKNSDAEEESIAEGKIEAEEKGVGGEGEKGEAVNEEKKKEVVDEEEKKGVEGEKEKKGVEGEKGDAVMT